MKNKLELAQWAVEYAKKVGADDGAVNIVNRRDVDIEYRDRKLEKLKESTQNSLSIHIYVNQRYSGSSTNDLRKEQLKSFIEEAVAGTKYLSQDEYRSLPDPKYYPDNLDRDLEILDSAYESVDSEKRVKLAKMIEEAALDTDDRIISTTAGYGDVHFERVKVHSNGFVGQKQGTVFSLSAEATVEDPGGGRPESWYSARTRLFDALPEPSKVGQEAVKGAVMKIGQDKIESGRYPMIVENRVASRLLRMLSQPLTGRAIQQKQSFLEGKLGQKIASDKFTLIDDPFIKRGLGSRLFDGDGLEAKKRAIIENGILKSYFIDDYYGRKLGMEPTTGGPSNLVFDYGSESLQNMIKDVDYGIWVTGFIGGNSNSTTGDFSFGITGQLIEKGQVAKPVNEMNISGNAIEFWNRLSKVGNDPHIYSSYRIPTMQFDDVQFSGV